MFCRACGASFRLSHVTDGTVRFFINLQMAAPLQIAKEKNEHVIFQLFLLFYCYFFRFKYYYPR